MAVEIICPIKGCGEISPNAIEAKNHLITVHHISEDQIGDLAEVNPHIKTTKGKIPRKVKIETEINVRTNPNQNIPPTYTEPKIKKTENIIGGQQQNMQQNQGPIPQPTAEEIANAQRILNDKKRADAINSPPISGGGNSNDVYNAETGQIGRGKSNMKMSSSDGKSFLIGIGCAILVLIIGAMFWLNPVYNKSINNITKQLTTMINNVQTTNATANSTAAGNISSLQTKYDGLITQDEATIKTLQGQLSTLQGSTQANQSMAQSALSTAQAAQSVANNGISQSVITSAIAPVLANEATDATSIKALQTQLAADEAIITTLKQQISTIVTTSTTTTTTAITTTSTGGTTTGVAGLTATIANTILGTSQTMNFNSFTASGSQTQNFSFILNNTNAITENNIQLGIILEAVQGATSNPSLLDLTSYPLTVSVNMNGYITTWSSQSTGQVGVLAFVNTIPGGILAGLGSISLNGGSSNQYTMNVTIGFTPSATVTSVPAFTVIPVIKVISATK